MNKNARPDIKPAPANPFPVVGLGASAGGLEALSAFLSSMPPESGMAFVVVTHQNPDHTNLLPELLQRHTTMNVLEVTDTVTLNRNQVYLSSPAYNLNLADGHLRLIERKGSRATSAPIDSFFRSLADVQDSKAIGVIFSGTGTDGALGLQEIKGKGGMIMVQSPETARFSGMPLNAISSGIVDFILTPEQMPTHLMQYASGLERERAVVVDQSLLPAAALQKILSLLHHITSNDFSNYKVNTMSRRIERRMNLHHIQKWEDYLRYLQENTGETHALFKELLIGVSSFFRDPEAFDTLTAEMAVMLDAKKENDTVRIWVPGCSTGEEAYSLAILIREYMDRTHKYLNVQIYGTDLDENSIGIARNGLYTDGIALDIDPKRLERNFIREDNHYRIRKPVREMVIFAVQNLVQDPPFTRLDMISCRNLLIYLDRELQDRILPMFHYALKPGGLMFLGSSESIGVFTTLYTPLSARWKIYKSIDTGLEGVRLRDFRIGISTPRVANDFTAAASKRLKETTITELSEKLLLRRFVPACILVNKEGQIVYTHGRTYMYLESASGRFPPTVNIVDLAKEGLRLPVSAIIRKAGEQEQPVVHRGITFLNEERPMQVDVTAQKLREPDAMQGLILLCFDQPAAEATQPPDKDEKWQNENEELERELMFIKEHLRQTIEELETTNEELKSTNEELQSANEEMQSSNEELETSREEMQSLNEELQSVNAELESKNKDLAYSYDDMKTLLNSTGIATVFLDNELRVKRFTMQAKKVIHLIPSDVGRFIRDIANELDYKHFIEDAEKVLQTLVYKEIEVKTRDWCWYLMRIMPYRTANNVIDGLVITFVEISELKKAEILLSAHNATLELLAKSRPLREILDSLLHAIERQSAGLCCCVHLLQSDRLVESSTGCLPRALAQILKEIPVNAGSLEPPAQAVHRHEKVIQQSLEAVKEVELARVALSHGFKSCWSEPIIGYNQGVIGVFTIFYPEERKPTPLETDLIKEATLLISLAIMRKHSGSIL